MAAPSHIVQKNRQVVLAVLDSTKATFRAAALLVTCAYDFLVAPARLFFHDMYRGYRQKKSCLKAVASAFEGQLDPAARTAFFVGVLGVGWGLSSLVGLDVSGPIGRRVLGVGGWLNWSLMVVATPWMREQLFTKPCNFEPFPLLKAVRQRALFKRER